MKIFLLSTSLLLNLFAFCQCDEYYINELISGNDDKCYFGGGTKVRFCPNLKGMAIGELTLDISQWNGISTQYITVTKNGGIAGTVVLKLNEKELLLNLNGCEGSRTYSISLSINKYELWLNDKPSRDLAKKQEALRLQEQKMKFKQDSINIQRIKAENNLNSYFKILDSSIVNSAIRNNVKFRKMIETSNVDTVIIDFKNSSPYPDMNINLFKVVDNYCKETDSYVHTEEYRSLTQAESKKIDTERWIICKNTDSSPYSGEYYLADLFFYNHQINADTVINGYRIPLNVRVQIVLSKKPSYSTDLIYKPEKYNGLNLFYSNEPFNDKYNFSGYYSKTYTDGFVPLPKDVKIRIRTIDKYLVIQKTKYNLIYANNIYLGKKYDSAINEFYKFKKVK